MKTRKFIILLDIRAAPNQSKMQSSTQWASLLMGAALRGNIADCYKYTHCFILGAHMQRWLALLLHAD